LIAQAEADGHRQLVETNEPVRLNVIPSSTASTRSRTRMAAEPLTQADAIRHRSAVDRAERALRELDQEGAQITFQAIGRRAGVSRQWPTAHANRAAARPPSRPHS
jgi:hypothetical protein